MNPLIHQRIRTKLTMIVMATSCTALLIACLSFVVNDLFSYRQVMLQDLTTRAQIIGNSSTAALTFGDPKPVEENLAALSADPHVVTACVFGAQGEVIASYRRPGSAETLPSRSAPSASGFTRDHLALFHDIALNQKTIGSVYLRSDLLGLRSRVKKNAAITALVMLAAIAVAFVLSSWLQRVISVPVTELARAAARVARDKDFTARVASRSNDEVGELVHAFNDMLEQVQERDRALQEAHAKLEARVEIRTQELKSTNALLQDEVEQRRQSQQELESTQQRLIEASHQAGMAEVATGVLHNVGNVLNSVNISATLLQDQLRQSRVATLIKTTQLMQQHQADLARFLTEDPKGARVAPLLYKLATHLANEQAGMLKETESLAKNIDHIKAIVAMQQTYARLGGVTELIAPDQLMEDALRICETGLARHAIQLVRDYAQVPLVAIDKHKALQIIINLIRNAQHALEQCPRTDKQLTIRIGAAQAGTVRLQVIDNGIGIPTENLTRIFQHGFTTKRDGHGFGLHSGALAAKQMNGNLTIHSDGLGLGSICTLDLPVQSESSHSPTSSQRRGESPRLDRTTGPGI